MAPIFRGDDGLEAGPSWEALVEKKIQDAMEQGLFDNLAGYGRPLQIEENPFEGDWRLGFHIMRNAGVAPPWIELSGEIQTRADALETLLRRAAELAPAADRRLRASLRDDYLRQVAELNEAIDAYNLIVPFVWLQKLRRSETREAARFDAAWPEPE